MTPDPFVLALCSGQPGKVVALRFLETSQRSGELPGIVGFQVASPVRLQGRANEKVLAAQKMNS